MTVFEKRCRTSQYTLSRCRPKYLLKMEVKLKVILRSSQYVV